MIDGRNAWKHIKIGGTKAGEFNSKAWKWLKKISRQSVSVAKKYGKPTAKILWKCLMRLNAIGNAIMAATFLYC